MKRRQSVSAEDKILFYIVVIFLPLFSPCRWRGWVSDVILFSIIWTSREEAAWYLKTFKVPPHSKNLSGQDDDKPVDELNSREQTETKYQLKDQQSLTSATWIPDRGQRALPFERNIRPMSTRRILNPWFENVLQDIYAYLLYSDIDPFAKNIFKIKVGIRTWNQKILQALP